MAYYSDPDVLTVSLHQQACYPTDTGNVGRPARVPARAPTSTSPSAT
jgi:acetoin utilization deacetylase AcuC-like enzyme